MGRRAFVKGGTDSLIIGELSTLPDGGLSVPAIPSFLIEPIWEQFAALLPARVVRHPKGGHRPRIDDRVVFDKLVQVLVFGCAYWRIADGSCSATTLRRRRDEWIALDVMATLERLVRQIYDQIIGLQLDHLAVDGCITKAPCGGQAAGRSPVDRGKQGTKRSIAVDAAGIPLGGIVAAASAHDSPLLEPTLDTLDQLGPLPDDATVHLDRGYDSDKTRATLAARGLTGNIAERGKPAPVTAGNRWVVERTNSWHNAHKKLVWCTERRDEVIDFYIAFANVIIIVRRLIREAWYRYRWATRPRRRP
jgi:Transposase DDE domain